MLHRYKNSRDGTYFSDLFDLIDEKHTKQAEVVGKAMRFGSMFSVDAPEKIAALKWQPQKKILTLSLTPDGHCLFGEVAQSRFASLAASLDAQTIVKDRRA